MRKLDIILRTCQQSMLEPVATNDSSRLSRICGDDREKMVLKCLDSLVATINEVAIDVTFTILDDHSSESFLEKMESCLKKTQTPSKIISLKEKGFNHSAYQQFLLASHCEDLIYCVEDDYLHEKKAISSMLAAYQYFTIRRPPLPILIFPFDCPFRYEPGKEELTQIFYDGVRYWRSIQKTTNTLLTHSSVIQRHFPTFETLALKYPELMEDDTINQLYFNHQNGQGSIAAFCPIPSLAYHLSYQEPTSINTEHLPLARALGCY